MVQPFKTLFFVNVLLCQSLVNVSLGDSNKKVFVEKDYWRHNTQHNNKQHNDIQHNGTRYNVTKHYIKYDATLGTNRLIKRALITMTFSL
jgi:hypothetical protein